MIWVVSSAVEHCLHTAGVTGSIPVPPTRFEGPTMRRPFCFPASASRLDPLPSSFIPSHLSRPACRLPSHASRFFRPFPSLWRPAPCVPMRMRIRRRNGHGCRRHQYFSLKIRIDSRKSIPELRRTPAPGLGLREICGVSNEVMGPTVPVLYKTKAFTLRKGISVLSPTRVTIMEICHG